MKVSSQIIHPGWLRVMHWVNALAFAVLLTSGWQIYNATAFFGFAFPKSITLGGWLAGALQWHFAAMWALGINGILYLAFNILSGRISRKFFPLSFKALRDDLLQALQGHLSHADPQRYNTVQRLAYLFVMVASAVIVASGLVLWKSVQFPLLRDLIGGYEGARIVHFVAMASLAGFVVVHMVMVALVPRTLGHMIRGH